MADKPKEIEKLLQKLSDDLVKEELSSEERLLSLSRLKVLGRDPNGCDLLFQEKGVSVLARHGFNRAHGEASREALRCLANALLLQPGTRQILTKLDYGKRATELLANEDIEDEFLASRILLILTYNPDFDVKHLVEEENLAKNVNNCLSRHAQASTQEVSKRAAALSETLKLLFNLYHLHPDLTDHFHPSFSYLHTLLHRMPPNPNAPLSPPTTHLINALMNFDLSLFPPSDLSSSLTPLLDLLSAATAAHTPTELEANALPLLTLLRSVYASAQPTDQAAMRTALLPSDSERALPLGRSATLPSRLLQLSASASSRSLRDAVGELLFDACGRDPVMLVRRIGYGFASGFLVNRGLEVPSSTADAGPAGEADAEGGGGATNFVTGQYLSEERPADGGPETMTEEEKLREAERLFVLFERLSATGVVDVQNPVRDAMQSGRFEEVSDDEEDDDDDEQTR